MAQSLTPKQERYVQGLVSGLSQREAYRCAYKSERMKPDTIDNAASRLLKDPKITARYDELMTELASRVLWDREKAVEVLMESLEASRGMVRLSCEVWTDDEGIERRHYDVPRNASRVVIDIVAELNRMFRIHESTSDDGRVVIVDDV